MSPLQSVQRRTGFETLEAKKLFAADLMGAAEADLPDTPVVAGFDPVDLVAELDPGDLVSVQMNPGDAATGGFSHFANLGGQDGEPVTAPVSDMVFENLGGQEGEPVIDSDLPTVRIMQVDGHRTIRAGDIPDDFVVGGHVTLEAGAPEGGMEIHSAIIHDSKVEKVLVGTVAKEEYGQQRTAQRVISAGVLCGNMPLGGAGGSEW